MSHSSLTPGKYLSKGEQMRLEKMLCRDNIRDTTMLLFMLKTGARPKETLNIRWCDINWYNHSVFIDTLKGGPPRSVPLSDDLFNRLSLIRLERDDGQRVFPIGYRMFCKIWHFYRPVKKKLHCLRHTFAVNLFASCKNVSIVKQALGHANIHTTSVYLQIEHSLDDLREHMR